MSSTQAYAKQVYERCQRLAAFSQDDSCMDRRYLTTEHKGANHQVAQWMELAGMSTWQDEAGNQWGRYASEIPDAPILVMGSHIDTVPNGGKYDGILGVLAPISLMQYFYDHQQSLPFHVDVVAFGDEEGTRFGSTLLGSCAIAGTWQQNWALLQDQLGTSLPKAFRDFGLDVNLVQQAARTDEPIKAFVELHIEQGPVLEAEDLAVGIVTAIAGAKRFTIQLQGQAGHAGTVPMHMRQDALSAASEMVLAVEALAKEHAVVATVGKLAVKPGAVNVIAGRAEFSLDIRSEDDAQRDKCLQAIQTQFDQIAASRKVSIEWQATHDAEAVKCDSDLNRQLSLACRKAEQAEFHLPSGAGHDAMAMAELCPVAMLFMRCEKGISHHPAEAINSWDIEAALDVLKHFVLDFH